MGGRGTPPLVCFEEGKKNKEDGGGKPFSEIIVRTGKKGKTPSSQLPSGEGRKGERRRRIRSSNQAKDDSTCASRKKKKEGGGEKRPGPLTLVGGEKEKGWQNQERPLFSSIAEKRKRKPLSCALDQKKEKKKKKERPIAGTRPLINRARKDTPFVGGEKGGGGAVHFRAKEKGEEKCEGPNMGDRFSTLVAAGEGEKKKKGGGRPALFQSRWSRGGGGR